jgi:hypothetical protein
MSHFKINLITEFPFSMRIVGQRFKHDEIFCSYLPKKIEQYHNSTYQGHFIYLLREGKTKLELMNKLKVEVNKIESFFPIVEKSKDQIKYRNLMIRGIENGHFDFSHEEHFIKLLSSAQLDYYLPNLIATNKWNSSSKAEKRHLEDNFTYPFENKAEINLFLEDVKSLSKIENSYGRKISSGKLLFLTRLYFEVKLDVIIKNTTIYEDSPYLQNYFLGDVKPFIENEELGIIDTGIKQASVKNAFKSKKILTNTKPIIEYFKNKKAQNLL